MLQIHSQHNGTAVTLTVTVQNTSKAATPEAGKVLYVVHNASMFLVIFN